MKRFIHDINESGLRITPAILADPLSDFASLLVSGKTVDPGGLPCAPDKRVLLEREAMTLRVPVHGVEASPIVSSADALDRAPLSMVFWCYLVPVGREIVIFQGGT